jgi:hypothetical protein
VGDRGLDALEAFQQLMDVVVLPNGKAPLASSTTTSRSWRLRPPWRRIAAISSSLVIR